MATMKKVEYPQLKTYIAQFGWDTKTMMLMLGYNVSNKFQFINLETGRIFNLTFETPEDAHEWLKSVATIHEEDIICTTYVP